MFRGNIVMKGYLKNPAATAQAFAGGWFHTGDLAVLEPDHYVKIKDRSKDVIISGGENISSLEVEDALYRHPAVMACAVVARPDPKWGETPLAYVELKSGATVSAAELIAHCRGLLAPTRCRARCGSRRSRRPPPARSRSSCCASGHARPARSNEEPTHEAAMRTEPLVLTRARRARGGDPDPQSSAGLQRAVEAMLAALQRELDALQQDATATVLVLAAAGKAFCAGHDLKEMRAQPSLDYYQDLFGAVQPHDADACARLPVPVIARVQGIATAAGCQLVAQCDLAVASSEARFAVSGVNLGLFCSTPAVPLSRNVACKPAFEMLVTGEFIDADQARERGLVNRVAEPAQLDAEVERLVGSILAKPRVAIAHGQGALLPPGRAPHRGRLRGGRQTMACNMMDEAALEGVQAFIEKRTPRWEVPS